MEFIDYAHKEFYEKKINELTKLDKTDVYYKSLIYTLSICETTREHFASIFNIKKGEININSIESAWQTGTSAKVTRMAFSLWNRCMYDSEEDRENDKMSSSYNPSEVFCCSYAPYFWEAIKIRYPEYTKYQQKDKTPRFTTYTRVGNIEQLEYYTEEKINNKLQERVVGEYIRVGSDNDDAIRYNINKQREVLEDYCKKNNIQNRIEYIDIGKSGLDENRKALQQMINDIKERKINEIIVTDISKLYRNPIKIANLLLEDFMQEIEITSLNDSAENFRNVLKLMEMGVNKEQQEEDEETM